LRAIFPSTNLQSFNQVGSGVVAYARPDLVLRAIFPSIKFRQEHPGSSGVCRSTPDRPEVVLPSFLPQTFRNFCVDFAHNVSICSSFADFINCASMLFAFSAIVSRRRCVQDTVASSQA
jgi:hypothetical protein